MKIAWVILRFAFAFLILVLLAIVTYQVTYSTLLPDASRQLQIVDYTNVVVILLTTVTVLFTVAAIALALAGIWGFRNIKEAAAEYARRSVALEIGKAFQPGGAAYEHIRKEFQDPDAPLNSWLRNEISRQVTETLALYPAELDIDESDPKDEGEVS